MKKTALNSGRLNLKKITIAALNDAAQQQVNGGIIQPTTTVLPTHQVACITNSAACPGPTTRTHIGCVQPTTTVQPSFVC
jgi:hypothetical protein